jgi:hypothetical protein
MGPSPRAKTSWATRCTKAPSIPLEIERFDVCYAVVLILGVEVLQSDVRNRPPVSQGQLQDVFSGGGTCVCLELNEG